MAKTYLDKDIFIKGITLEPEDVEVPGLGVVQVRGLTAVEMASISEKAKGDTGEMMVRATLYGLLQPKLSEEDIDALRGAAAMKFMPVMQRIMELSGQGAAEETRLLAGGGS